MTLKFKRNYPLVLILASILSVLAWTMGNQPIASYTANPQVLQAAQLSIISDGIDALTSVFNMQNTPVNPQASMLSETWESVQP